MFTSKHFINLISSFIIGIISLIFVYNYSLVYLQPSFIFIRNPLLFIIVYLGLFFFVIFSFNKINFALSPDKSNKLFTAAIIIVVLFLIYYLIFLQQPSGGNIKAPERPGTLELLAVKNWLNNFYTGIFPYQFGNTFSAFPFLYLTFSPFYWIGNPALIEVLAWVIIGLLVIYKSKSLRERIIKLFLLLVSPLTFYGLFETPLIFVYSAVLVVLIFFSNKYINPAKVDRYFILFAVLFGLFFSIKIEVIIPIVIYLLFLFRNNLKEGFLFGETLLASFLITVIPFILWNPKLFFINGPLLSFFMFGIPWWGIVIILIITIYIGWMTADTQEIFFAAGILLIIYSFINFLIAPFTGLSSFIFSIPFLIFSIKDYKVEKFLGKIL